MKCNVCGLDTTTVRFSDTFQALKNLSRNTHMNINISYFCKYVIKKHFHTGY